MYQQKSQSQQKQLLTRWSRCSWTTAMVLVAVATHIDANERGLRPRALTPMCAFFLLSFPPFYRKRKKKKRQKTNPDWIFLGETQPRSITKRTRKRSIDESSKRNRYTIFERDDYIISEYCDCQVL